MRRPPDRSICSRRTEKAERTVGMLNRRPVRRHVLRTRGETKCLVYGARTARHITNEGEETTSTRGGWYSPPVVEGDVSGATRRNFSREGASLASTLHKKHTGYIIPRGRGEVAAAVTVAGV